GGSRGGELYISTEIMCSDTDMVSVGRSEKDNFYVKIVVQDSGCGMSAEVREKIFEPFFTTKEPGKGTGMGLSMVYGIVQNHGGYIEVKSKLGEGSRFEIFLPFVDGVRQSPQVERISQTVIAGGVRQ